MFGSTRTSGGFTLLEMMIVAAILAVIIALAIPSLLRSRSAANETSASATLRTLVTLETTCRQSDIDRNGTSDWWTADVSGFYRIASLSLPGMGVAQIDTAIAEADDEKESAGAAVAGAVIPGTGMPAAGLVALPRTSPKSGYFYRAVITDAAAPPTPYEQDPDLNGQTWTNTGEFAFQARPEVYDNTGVGTYIVNEQGVVYSRDFGNALPANAAVWPGANPTTSGWKVVP